MSIALPSLRSLMVELFRVPSKGLFCVASGTLGSSPSSTTVGWKPLGRNAVFLKLFRDDVLGVPDLFRLNPRLVLSCTGNSKLCTPNFLSQSSDDHLSPTLGGGGISDTAEGSPDDLVSVGEVSGSSVCLGLRDPSASDGGCGANGLEFPNLGGDPEGEKFRLIASELCLRGGGVALTVRFCAGISKLLMIQLAKFLV